MKKLRLWRHKHYSDYRGYLYIKTNNQYIKGVVGTDIKLTLWQRIQILFRGGVSVVLHGE